MSRIAFRQCGWAMPGEPVSLNPLNGWFWPNLPIEDDQGTGTGQRYALALTAEEFFHFWWRIKSFRATGSLSAGDQSWSFDISVPNLLTTERDLIAGTPLFEGSEQLAGGAPQTVSPEEPEAGFVGVEIGGNFKFEGGVFFVDVTVFANMYADDAGDVVGGGARSDYLPLEGTAYGGVTCAIMGKTIALGDNPGDGEDVIIPSHTGTVTIVPDSYWEYRNEEGENPIFAGGSGEQILSPIPRGL